VLYQGSATLVGSIRAISVLTMEKEKEVVLVPVIEEFEKIYNRLEE
jgi:hypothetical protein